MPNSGVRLGRRLIRRATQVLTRCRRRTPRGFDRAPPPVARGDPRVRRSGRRWQRCDKREHAGGVRAGRHEHRRYDEPLDGRLARTRRDRRGRARLRAQHPRRMHDRAVVRPPRYPGGTDVLRLVVSSVRGRDAVARDRARRTTGRLRRARGQLRRSAGRLGAIHGPVGHHVPGAVRRRRNRCGPLRRHRHPADVVHRRRRGRRQPRVRHHQPECAR